MREIEFRGKTIKGGEWKYGDLIKTNGATGDGWGAGGIKTTDFTD